MPAVFDPVVLTSLCQEKETLACNK